MAQRQTSAATRVDAPRNSRLIAAARAALAENGGALEMADVAARAGVSTGLAYHYFGSKSGLLSAVVEDFYDRYDAVMNQRMDGRENWARREKRRLGAVVSFLCADPLAPVILGKLSRSPEVVAVEIARQRMIVALAARNIESGIRSGDIGADVDPVIAAAAIIGGVRHAVSHVLEQRGSAAPKMLAENLWTFIAGAVRLKEAQP